MATADILRNNIISRLLEIGNEDYLATIYRILNEESVESGPVKLSSEQRLMLEMSENDIRAGRTVTQHELDAADLEWLSGQ
jgi:hypothetical protein